MRMVLAAIALLLWPTAALADVRELERDGFVLVLESTVPVAQDRAFAAMTRPADWWDSDHSWSGSAANFTFEPRAGGCWCEALRDGGSLEHGRIVTYDPGRGLIVMNSLLGPLMETGMAGRLIWRVEPADQAGRSVIRWLYRVNIPSSRNPAQDAVFAAAVDQVLAQQLARLTAFVSGAPIPAPAP
jgi:hypothetical protein